MTTSQLTTNDIRQSFFNEEGDMLPPFRDSSWRGCVVDPDLYGRWRMPRELFEAIIEVSATSHISVCGYFTSENLSPITTINAGWEELGDFLLENHTPECLIFSPSRDWAILGDFDATVLGARPDIADRIDSRLASSATSLKEMSRPMLSGENTVVVNYFKAVVGVN